MGALVIGNDATEAFLEFSRLPMCSRKLLPMLGLLPIEFRVSVLDEEEDESNEPDDDD